MAGDVVGEELEGDDGQQRLDDLGRVGDRQEDVRQRGDRRRRPRCRRRRSTPSRARTSSMLLRVLAWSEPAGRDEDAGGLAIDQGDRPVLHLGGRIALGVDVADLLELQRPFERDGEVEVAAEVEGAAGARRSARRPPR